MVRYVFLIALILAPLQALAACLSTGTGTATCDGNLTTDTGGYSPDGQIIINSPNSMPSTAMHNDDSSISKNNLSNNDTSPPEKCTNNCYPFESLFEDEKSSYTPKKTSDSNPHYADHNDPWNH